MNHTVTKPNNKALSLGEISPLPGKINSFTEQRDRKVASYQGLVKQFEKALAQDNLDPALELADKADATEREVDTLTTQIKRCETELNSLIVEKLTDARVLFKRLGSSRNGQAEAAANYLLKAKEAQKAKDLTAALLQAHQAITLLQSLARNHVNSRLTHHRKKVSTF